jgi:hypothetical protein
MNSFFSSFVSQGNSSWKFARSRNGISAQASPSIFAEKVWEGSLYEA